MDYLCGNERFDIGDEYDMQQKLYIAMIRYRLSLNSYQKYITTKIASNVSEETVAAIYENQWELAGISVTEESIRVEACRDSRCLRVTVEDEGGGVREEELPLLKEKLRRGQNAGKAEGAGLGLYISDYFMREMEGGLLVENGEKGLRVTVVISQGGR